MSRPQPVEGREWIYTASTSDNSQVRVRYLGGRWWDRAIDDSTDWEANSEIPDWPGTFTTAGGLITGPGTNQPDSFPAVLDPGCGYRIPAGVARQFGATSGLLTRLNDDNVYRRPTPPAELPPEYAALMDFAKDRGVGETADLMAAADAEKREAATRAELKCRVAEAIDRALEGHRGIAMGFGPAIADQAAVAAIEAFVSAVRGGHIVHITTPAGALPIRPGVLIYDGVRYIPDPNDTERLEQR